MRRWTLVCLCIASAGGACSPRTLLGITLTSTDLVAAGNPLVVVVGPNGTIARDLDKTDADGPLLRMQDGKVSFGVYLPDDLSGSVLVSASLVGLCQTWSGESQTVQVVPHEVTTVTIGVTSGPTQCPPSGGTDGGISHPDALPDEADADAATDALESSETSVGSDGAIEVTCAADAGATDASGDGQTLTCSDYCGVYIQNCSDSDPDTVDECVTGCMTAGWPPGSVAPNTPNANTIGCRLEYAYNAADPGQRARFCGWASAKSAVCAP
jgi:hypothetical protein